jgi:RNA polymerase-binding protein DksA
LRIVSHRKKVSVARKVDEEVSQKQEEDSTKGSSLAQTSKGHLTAADIERLKQVLLRKCREIACSVGVIESEALNKADGDLSNMPTHMADAGTDSYEQEFALGLMDSKRRLLRKIDDALDRIEQKTYGTCEATGVPISKARLEAKPWARYCVEYARKLEQGLVTEQEQDEDSL